jgi:hypothetical protein
MRVPGLFICTAALLTALPAAEPAAGPGDFDRFGGARAIRREATGFFRVEPVGGRWLFVTPEGHGFLALGANHLGKAMLTQARPVLDRFDGDTGHAAAALLDEIRRLGLNAGDAYAPAWPPLRERLPWIAHVGYPDTGREGTYAFDVFDPAWQARLRAKVEAACRELAVDPWVIGIAFADQPDWTARRVAYFAALPDTAPGKQRLLAHRRAGGGDEDFLAHVADAHYAQLRAAVRAGAPRHLFLGERFVLRKAPDAVLRAVGRHVDVFSTQALILSRQRPPEWQEFQADAWDHEARLTGRPVLVIDWAAPFSLAAAFDSEHGRIKAEADAATDAARWLSAALAHPAIVGVFRCQLLGTHGNDRWFDGRARRNYLRPDGTPFPVTATAIAAANRAALHAAYTRAAANP